MGILDLHEEWNLDEEVKSVNSMNLVKMAEDESRWKNLDHITSLAD